MVQKLRRSALLLLAELEVPFPHCHLFAFLYVWGCLPFSTIICPSPVPHLVFHCCHYLTHMLSPDVTFLSCLTFLSCWSIRLSNCQLPFTHSDHLFCTVTCFSISVTCLLLMVSCLSLVVLHLQQTGTCLLPCLEQVAPAHLHAMHKRGLSWQALLQVA